jgi:hypothetical protein
MVAYLMFLLRVPLHGQTLPEPPAYEIFPPVRPPSSEPENRPSWLYLAS